MCSVVKFLVPVQNMQQSSTGSLYSKCRISCVNLIHTLATLAGLPYVHFQFWHPNSSTLFLVVLALNVLFTILLLWVSSAVLYFLSWAVKTWTRSQICIYDLLIMLINETTACKAVDFCVQAVFWKTGNSWSFSLWDSFVYQLKVLKSQQQTGQRT